MSFSRRERAGGKKIPTSTAEWAFSSGLFCRRRMGRWPDRRVDPAGMLPGVERLGRLRVDVALPHDATEADLDVLARTTEPIVEIEVAESGIEVVAPHQADRPFAQPDAFGTGGGAAHGAAGVGHLVEPPGLLAAIGFGRFAWLRLRVLGVDRDGEQAGEDGRHTQYYTEHDGLLVGGRARPGRDLCWADQAAFADDYGAEFAFRQWPNFAGLSSNR